MHRKRRIVSRRERWKLAPGTGTASSGVPVWEKTKPHKPKSTFHPFYII